MNRLFACAPLQAGVLIAALTGGSLAPSVAATSPTGAAPQSPTSASATSPAAPLTYAKDAGPVFHRNCVRCHNPDDDSGGLRLDTYEGVLRGGERGPAIVARNASASLLIQKVLHKDRPFMPPRKTLPAAEVAILRAWIDGGAHR